MNKSDLQMALHLYREELEVRSHKISVSATVESCCQFRPLDWSDPELDWAFSVVDFQEGKDIIFIPFPFTFVWFSLFCVLFYAQTCVARVLEMEGIWKEEPFKTPSGNLGKILYAHHLRWSDRKECVLEKDL